jgi:transcriptional regulator with XRE-family HTH domain
MKQPKNYWADNIRFLRIRKKLSQEALATKLGITRSKLNAHENGQTQNPVVEDLIRFSDYFKMSIDTLLRTELSRLSEFKIRELEAGNDIYVTGSKIRVLAISTDKDNNENIEYVPAKAKMGYKAGYSDPEYIASLPKCSLPGLPGQRTYRIFPSTGESMLPIKPGTDFITEYVENWETLKDSPCVLVLKSEGADFVFKYVTWQKKERSFLLRSLNEAAYPPYAVPADEVLEVWKYHKHITNELPVKESSLQQLAEMVKEMKAELGGLKKR